MTRTHTISQLGADSKLAWCSSQAVERAVSHPMKQCGGDIIIESTMAAPASTHVVVACMLSSACGNVALIMEVAVKVRVGEHRVGVRQASCGRRCACAGMSGVCVLRACSGRGGGAHLLVSRLVAVAASQCEAPARAGVEEGVSPSSLQA